MSEAIAAVVFDLDRVLVASESVWDAARREIVARNGGCWQADATRAMISPEWSRYLHDQLGVPLEPKQINELVVAALLGQYRRRLPLLPGAVVAVRRLADRWPLGLASSAKRPVIDVVLEQAGITDCFGVTVSGEEVAAGKPAPDVYLTATRRLGVNPADAAAVEDSTNGLQAAAAAGMIVIASPNREYPPEPDALALAALVVKSLDELTPDAIESAAQRARKQRASGWRRHDRLTCPPSEAGSGPMPAFGTKRTCRSRSAMSALKGKADVERTFGSGRHLTALA
jgi:HAD superfamily hydrolase (TIGR01509 family)